MSSSETCFQMRSERQSQRSGTTCSSRIVRSLISSGSTAVDDEIRANDVSALRGRKNLVSSGEFFSGCGPGSCYRGIRRQTGFEKLPESGGRHSPPSGLLIGRLWHLLALLNKRKVTLLGGCGDLLREQTLTHAPQNPNHTFVPGRRAR